ncbi:MAG TPA: FAD-dependent monooxygenase [Acetobacteraceae bacterium]|nr:FAD-dependent monooxygenase [Acetobacteraceae bacterium]
MPDILVVGAGPVGLTLAAELARHGTTCRIIDRLPQPLPWCRAIGVSPRTLEVWDDMGVARDLIDAGLWLQGMRSIVDGRVFAEAPVPDPPDDRPYATLGVPQNMTEQVLTRHLARFGIGIERGTTLASLSQDADAVAVRLEREGGTEDASFRYVVGCDGAHSTVRRAIGIEFEGDAFPMPFMLGDVRIDWDLPRGVALRAMRLHEDAAPDMFIAIPLPEPGRYRVSALAPPALVPAGTSDHGIQAELRGPDIGALQAVSDDLVPDRPRLADLRWSSIFRISMRLAARYRVGRAFIAGDAAHIHPPTGGQGMNTGIQDAYNLAWKVALVANGAAPDSLLDSYEAERHPVGAEVVARTRAASEGYGREPSGRADRDANSQLGISYRGTPWVREDAPDLDQSVPAAGDRAPDAGGLRRRGLGFPMRLFDALRGPEHVLLAHLPDEDAAGSLADLAATAAALPPRSGSRLRVVAIVAAAAPADAYGVTALRDSDGRFAAAYGAAQACFLVRPDGHIGWRGPSWRDDGLTAQLARSFC